MEGFISGFIGTLVTHPLEVLKVKRQASLFDNKQIFKGILINPTVYGLHYLIYFKCYSTLKKEYSPFQAAFISQGISCLTLNSLWIVRTKRMTMGMDYSKILLQMNKEYFYKGLMYSNILCFQTGLSFSILEYLNGSTGTTGSTVNTGTTVNNGTTGSTGNTGSTVTTGNTGTTGTTGNIIINSFISRTASGIVFYPIDTMRTMRRCDQQIFLNRGILSFYNGIGYYLLRSVPSFVIVNYIHSILSNSFFIKLKY